MTKMYDALKRHRYLWQVFTLLVIVGFNAHHALAAIPHEISIGCPGTPVPEAPSDLMRVKGDSEVWAFIIKPEPGVTIDHQVWTYRGKDGGEPEWGSFSGGDGTNGLNWASPNIADHFTINVKAKRHCAGSGEGPDDFELTWGGDVVSVIIKRDGVDITEPQDNPQEVKVGEMINLSAEIQNAPGNANITYQWTVPGINYKNWAGDGSAAVATVTHEPSTNFYWVDGGNGREVSCTATVNDRTLPVVKTRFDVDRPNYEFTVTPTGIVEVGTDTGYPDADGSTLLHYGAPFSAVIMPGVTFASNPPNTNHWLKLLQVAISIDNRIRSGVQWWEYRPKSGLDGYPAPGTDSPSQSIDGYDEMIMNQNFKTWLMYTPPTQGAMPVPLKVLEWSWLGHALKHGTTWQHSSVPGKGDLTMAVSANAATGIDTTDYPTWTGNITPESNGGYGKYYSIP